MQHLTERAGPVPIVVITAFGNLDVAVTAMRNGAVRLSDQAVRSGAGRRSDRSGAGSQQNGRGPASSAGAAMRAGTAGPSPAMQEVFKRIALVAPSDASVLIMGESGTGKELVARAIHRHSRRAAEPFVPIHLASLSPTLVESELFGHVRGAFTGAEDARQGLLELANEGDGVLRRSRRHSAGRAGQAAARARTARSDAGGRHAIAGDVVSRDRGHEPGSAGRSRRRSGCGAICISAWRRSKSSCRRCANGSRTFRCWPRHSCGWPTRARHPLPRLYARGHRRIVPPALAGQRPAIATRGRAWHAAGPRRQIGVEHLPPAQQPESQPCARAAN